MSAIVCQNLTKKFADFEVLRGISLAVERGELFGFLGPNGAGKTTTIRIMTGLLLPSGGSIEIAGFDVVREPFEVKRRVGYVPDRAFLYDKLTGLEFLEFVGHLYGLSRDKVWREAEGLLDLFDLIEWKDELVEAYSHGMRQKLAMTAALLHRPEVVVIDEPMVGLDPRSARHFKSLLRDIVAGGQTVFMSTHTLEVAETLCSRVGIIQNGQIIAMGTIDELREQASYGDHSLEEVFLKLTEESPTLSEPVP